MPDRHPLFPGQGKWARLRLSGGGAHGDVRRVTRGLFRHDFVLVFISQVGIAVGPPLSLGAITKLAGRWFPRDERATATGLGTLAIYLGILASLIVTPLLLNSYVMKMMLVCTGIVSAVAAAFHVATVREKPPTPAGPGDQEVRCLMFDGLRSMMKQKDFMLQALAGLLPGLAGLASARSYGLLLVSSFVFGLFLLSEGKARSWLARCFGRHGLPASPPKGLVRNRTGNLRDRMIWRLYRRLRLNSSQGCRNEKNAVHLPIPLGRIRHRGRPGADFPAP